MSLKHKKVSGLENTAVDKVGGEDWDDEHVFSTGDVFLFGWANLLFDGTTGGVSEASPAVVGDIVFVSGSGSKYRMTMNIDISKLPIRAGVSWAPRVVFEYLSDSYQTRRFQIESYNWNTGQIVFILDNVAGSATGVFTSFTFVRALINIEVLT